MKSLDEGVTAPEPKLANPQIGAFANAGEFSFIDLKSGQVIEMLNDRLYEAIRDVFNTDKDAEAKREVTVKVTLVPNKERDNINVVVEADVKLAPRPKVGTSIGVGIDVDGRVIVADHNVRQGRLFNR